MGKKYELFSRKQSKYGLFTAVYLKEILIFEKHRASMGEKFKIPSPSYRNLSQLGTCYGSIVRKGQVVFGDAYATRNVLMCGKSIYPSPEPGHYVIRPEFFSRTVICQRITFPNKLTRFVRS